MSPREVEHERASRRGPRAPPARPRPSRPWTGRARPAATRAPRPSPFRVSTSRIVTARIYPFPALAGERIRAQRLLRQLKGEHNLHRREGELEEPLACQVGRHGARQDAQRREQPDDHAVAQAQVAVAAPGARRRPRPPPPRPAARWTGHRAARVRGRARARARRARRRPRPPARRQPGRQPDRGRAGDLPELHQRTSAAAEASSTTTKHCRDGALGDALLQRRCPQGRPPAPAPPRAPPPPRGRCRRRPARRRPAPRCRRWRRARCPWPRARRSPARGSAAAR